MRTWSRACAMLFVLIAGLTLAACGSSDDDDGPAASTASTASTTKAPDGPAFKLGALCSCSGVQAASLGDVQAAAEVWVKSVNANGGINGRPVELTVLDDGGNAAKALQNVKKLVESDKVQAIVGDSSFATDSYLPYLKKAGIPVIGGNPSALPFMSEPTFFASGGNIVSQLFGVAQMAKDAGAKKLGILYCAETPLCKQIVPLGQGAAGLSKLQFSSAAVSSTAPNYTAPCIAFKDQGVDALFVANNGAIVQRVIADCARQGYKPTVLSLTSTAVPVWLEDENFEGALVAASNPAHTDTSNPGVTAFLEAVEQFAPELKRSPAFTAFTFFPWVSGQLFEAAAEAADLSPSSTPDDVKAALLKLDGETLDGLTPPLTFSDGKPTFVGCYYALKIADGAYENLGEGKPSCLSPDQVAQLTQAPGGAKQ